MKNSLAIVSLSSVMILSGVLVASAAQPAGNGFDELGYNRNARIFNGPADGTDGVLDGNIWGDPTYANDHLKMKWNSEWDRGNAEGWTDPNGYRAWIDNQWNGNVPNGSGETWHYKIKWVGPCVDGTVSPSGGVCIWGQFEIVMSHGDFNAGHVWDVHAKPSGFGN